jgi:predicted RNA methylase
MARKTSPRRAPDHVLAKLERLRVSGNVALRYEAELDREEYLAMNHVLEALGGKWNRKANGHIFAGDPTPLLTQVLETGVYADGKKDFGFFETPPELAREIVLRARIGHGDRILEPSAGRGRIAQPARATGADVTCVEIQGDHVRFLRGLGFVNVFEADFLSMPLTSLVGAPPVGFDAILMNPPFAGQVDIDHVLHAFGMLRPGGTLVSVMAAGVTFRENQKTRGFREFVSECAYGSIEPLPDGTFEESGTGVRTVLVTLRQG